MALVDQEQAEEFLSDHLLGNLPSGITSDLINWPNQNTETKPSNVSWLEFDINWAQSVNVEAGSNPLIRTPGIVLIDVNVPINDGNATINEIVQSLISSYRNMDISGVTTEDIQVDVIGEQDSWYTRRVNVFFYIEEF